MSLLHKVVSHGRVKQLRLLLSMGPDIRVNARDDTEKTPLILCALIDKEDLGLKMFKLLMQDERTDHDATDIFGRNIFTYAIIKGRVKMLQILLDNRATVSTNCVDTSGLTNLHHAVNNGNVSILSTVIQLFLEMGQSIDQKTPSGFTALALAIKSEKFDCANVLILEGRASYLARDAVYYLTAKEWAQLKLKKYQKDQEESIVRCNLISRARTEQKITLRRRGIGPPPRSALTAPTTGLPFLTTRASNTRVSNSLAYKYNELKRLNMIIDSKQRKDPSKSPGSSRRTVKYFDNCAPPIASESSLPSIYLLLQKQMSIQEEKQQPLLPVNCNIPKTRLSSLSSMSA